MDKWRLYSEFENGEAVSGFIKYVRIFGIISTACAYHCLHQFYEPGDGEDRTTCQGRLASGKLLVHSENIWSSDRILSGVFDFIWHLPDSGETTLPWFNQPGNKELAVPYAHLWFWGLVASYGFNGIARGQLSGIFTFGFSPKTILKGIGNARPCGGSVLPRKVLVVLQFSLSIGLIIGTLAVFLQLRYTMARPSGYDPGSGLVMVNTTPDLARNFQVLKNER
ncbi:MAG: hypothetical protein R2806_04800 [Saprospiraceae bacterium]